VSEWIEQEKAWYLEAAYKLGKLSYQADGPSLSARRIAAFVVCTPQQKYENAVQQWCRWMKTGRVKGALAERRRKMIYALPPVDWEGWARQEGESGASWAWRLQQECKGLGLVKAPFLTCLLEPLAFDVRVCIDVHMVRFLGRKELKHPNKDKVAHRQMQRKLARLAQEVKLPPFVYQWCVWDWKRSGGEVKTDIARDLKRGLEVGP
jgi:hypothetical protein